MILHVIQTIAETIVPQYTQGTPGAIITPTMTTSTAPGSGGGEDRFGAAQTADILRNEVKDLGEKLESLKGSFQVLIQADTAKPAAERHRDGERTSVSSDNNSNCSCALLILAKRAADQEKLREIDRLRLQVETLSEFKSKVLESQSILQRDLKKVICRSRIFLLVSTL